MDFHQIDHQSTIACSSSKNIGTYGSGISELFLRSFSFGSNISLSTLRFLCYRRKRKTRYAAIWLIFCDGTFTRKLSAALPSALEQTPNVLV